MAAKYPLPPKGHFDALAYWDSIQWIALITGSMRLFSATTPDVGSCLKAGQHFIFVIIYLLLPINCIILDSVSKILLFNFFMANNNNYDDSNNENIAP